LFVSCGATPEGLHLLVFDPAKGTVRLVGPGHEVRTVSARAIGGDGLKIDDAFVRAASLRPNGEALRATLTTGRGEIEGLAWRTSSHIAVAWGPVLARHVILFYPAVETGVVEGRWTLGERPEIASEKLRRLAD
jgi:hypothetical protein